MDPSKAVPLCLPENYSWNEETETLCFEEDMPRGDLTMCRAGFKLLESIREDPVMVICITGPARTGKSFFLSSLQRGVTFKVGHTTESQTTGIWIALGPSSIEIEGQAARLVLLDAEGVGAVSSIDQNISEEWDKKVFSVSTLLSSYLIYNSMGIPNNSDLDKLGFIAKFSETIFFSSQATSAEQGKYNFKNFFPHFLWLLRDTHLTPKVDGENSDWTTFLIREILAEKKVTAVTSNVNSTEQKNSSTFAENSLSYIQCKGQSHDQQHHSEQAVARKERMIERGRSAVRKAIRDTFQSFHAFGLPIPSIKPCVLLDILNSKNEQNINPDFIKGVDEIKHIILSSSALKKMQGRVVLGGQLIYLLKSFLTTVNKKFVNFQIDDICTEVAKSHLEDVKTEVLFKYNNNIANLNLPLPHKEVVNIHESEKSTAVALFDSQTKYVDNDLKLQIKSTILQEMEEQLVVLIKRNEVKSQNICKEQTEKLEKAYLTCFKKDPETYSCMDLDVAYRKIMQEFNANAKGPMIDIARKAIESKLNKQLSTYRIIIFRALEKNVELLLSEETGIIKQQMPIESKDLEAAFNCLKRSAQDIISKKCNDCDSCIKLKNDIKDMLQERFHVMEDMNKNSSEIHCRNLIEQLKSKNLEAVFSSPSTKTNMELEEVRENSLKSYDKHAKGPMTLSQRINFEEYLKRQLLKSQNSILNSSERDAKQKVLSSMKNIMAKCPYEEGELLLKCKTLSDHVIAEFRERCKGIEDLNSKTEAIARKAEEITAVSLKENLECSVAFCETEVENICKQCSAQFKILLIKFNEAEVHLNFSINRKLLELKDSFLNKFDSDGKGPAKSQVRQTCEDKLTKLAYETEMQFAEIGSEKGIAIYRQGLLDAMKEGPHDPNVLKNIQVTLERKVYEVFDNITFNFQTSTYEIQKTELTSFMESENKVITEHNFALSQSQCEAVKLTIMKCFNTCFKEFKGKIFNDEIKGPNVSFEFKKLKNHYLKRFNDEARGPCKKHIRRDCETEMDECKRDLRNLKIGLAKKDFLSRIHEMIKNGPHNEKELQHLRDEAVKDIERYFDEGDIETSQTRAFLKFIEEQVEYLFKANIENSKLVCEKERISISRHFLQWCKKFTHDVNGLAFPDMKNISNTLTSKSKTMLDSFDKSAKGPKSSEERKTLVYNLEQHLRETEETLSDIVLQKAIEEYHALLGNISADDCKHEKDLQKKQRETASTVLYLLLEICKGFDKVMMAGKKRQFQSEVRKLDEGCYDLVHQISLKICRNARNKFLVQFQNDVQKLVQETYFINNPCLQQFAMRFHGIKRTTMQMYQDEAKGPAKLEMHLKLYEEVDHIFEITNKHVRGIIFRRVNRSSESFFEGFKAKWLGERQNLFCDFVSRIQQTTFDDLYYELPKFHVLTKWCHKELNQNTNQVKDELWKELSQLFFQVKANVANILLHKAVKQYQKRLMNTTFLQLTKEDHILQGNKVAKELTTVFTNLCSIIDGELINSKKKELDDQLTSLHNDYLLCKDIQSKPILVNPSNINKANVKGLAIQIVDEESNQPTSFARPHELIRKTEDNITNIVLAEVMTLYKERLTAIRKTCPDDEQQLEAKYQNIAKEVKTSYSWRVEGLEESVHTEFYNRLAAEMNEENNSLLAWNREKSMSSCERLIKSLLSRDTCDTLDAFLSLYKAEAKGPQKEYALIYHGSKITKRYSNTKCVIS